MYKRALSLLLAAVMVFSLIPTALADGVEGDAYYTLTIEYVVQQSTSGTSDIKIAPDYKASMLPDSQYSVVSPTVKGYKVEEGKQTVTGTLNESTTIQVEYTYEEEEAEYTINYIGRDVTGEFIETLETIDDETAPIGTIVHAKDKIFDDYIRDAGTLDLYVTADGKAELNVYYTEMVNPYIIFKTDGSYVAPITAKAGEEIPQSEINRVNDSENPPTRKGYEFAGWDWNGDGKYDANDTPLEKMPEGAAKRSTPSGRPPKPHTRWNTGSRMWKATATPAMRAWTRRDTPPPGKRPRRSRKKANI